MLLYEIDQKNQKNQSILSLLQTQITFNIDGQLTEMFAHKIN